MAKPELTLLKVDSSLDEIIKACEHITGRKCTPEEIDEAKKLMAEKSKK